jgi:hypothetical protein
MLINNGLLVEKQSMLDKVILTTKYFPTPARLPWCYHHYTAHFLMIA